VDNFDDRVPGAGNYVAHDISTGAGYSFDSVQDIELLPATVPAPDPFSQRWENERVQGRAGIR
jgi:hypothetical protein